MNHFCLGLHANDELNVAGENGKVLVNINHPNKDSDIFLPEAITQTLKPHQVCPLILHCVKSVQIQFFSDLYFLVFGLNTEIYGVNLPIQSECRKIRTRKNSVFGLRSEIVALFFHFYNPRKWASMDELYLKVKLEAQPFTGVLPNSCCKKIFGIRKNHS